MSPPSQPLRAGPPALTPTAEALGRALTRPAAPPIEIRESFAGWVVLAEDRAYRLHKRVRHPSLDLVTFEGRLLACRAIVKAERALGSDIVLGVRSLVPIGDSFALADEGHHDAVDHVVEMRRYDERATLAARVRAGRLAPDEAAAVGRRVAAFHAGAVPVRAPEPLVADRHAWHAALEGIAALLEAPLVPRRRAAIERFADAFARARGGQLRERAADDRVRDGHGDLRASHVVMGAAGVELVGREVYDVGLRRVDPAEDLCTLLMELERLGARASCEALLAAYESAGGNAGDEQLRAAWSARRALVAAARTGSAEDARTYAELAERLVWRARGPVALVVCGRPPDGRARLARTLAERSGWPLLRDRAATDVEHLAIEATSIVVEHPLAEAGSQRSVVDAIRRSGRQPRLLECRSQSTLHAAITPDVPTRHRLVVDPEGDAEDLVDAAAAWLDASLRDLAPARQRVTTT